MTIKIKELPLSERPYEKLEIYGENALTNAELLAIIIKNGTKNDTSVELAKRILKLNENIDSQNLNFLMDLSIEELKQIKGIGRVKAIQLKAVCELARRINQPIYYRKKKIREPKDAVKTIEGEMKYLKNEVLKVIILNSSNEILKIKEVLVGGTNFIEVSTKNILSEAVKMQAPKIILVHNHPSGNSLPSQKDIEYTKTIERASKLLGIQLLDHIIIAGDSYTSIFAYIDGKIEDNTR
ncbi:MAG: DNA repair protein RadC [Clostridia bacterium]|nr:DNA repair protein RadC [Clostridia bacterium]